MHEKVSGSGSAFVSKQCNFSRIPSELSGVFLQPFEQGDLIHQSVVGHPRLSPSGRTRVGVEESCEVGIFFIGRLIKNVVMMDVLAVFSKNLVDESFCLWFIPFHPHYAIIYLYVVRYVFVGFVRAYPSVFFRLRCYCRQ